jgi:hypothetical protein
MESDSFNSLADEGLRAEPFIHNLETSLWLMLTLNDDSVPT